MRKRNNPVLLGRTAAFFYLLQFAFGPAMIVLKKVFVANDASRTASNILANETFGKCLYPAIWARSRCSLRTAGWRLANPAWHGRS